jgi:hypothetical protein
MSIAREKIFLRDMQVMEYARVIDYARFIHVAEADRECRGVGHGNPSGMDFISARQSD